MFFKKTVALFTVYSQFQATFYPDTLLQFYAIIRIFN